jgi:hypothetical protein
MAEMDIQGVPAELTVVWYGLGGERRWGFVDDDDNGEW